MRKEEGMKGFYYIFPEGKSKEQIESEKESKKSEGYKVVTFLEGNLQLDEILIELMKNYME